MNDNATKTLCTHEFTRKKVEEFIVGLNKKLIESGKIESGCGG